MATIPDERLYLYADRVKGKVVLITGGANGIGKEIALTFAKHGAKIIIGDRDIAGAEKTVAEIIKAGGEASAIRCDVLVWEEQVAMFDLAIAKFGAVDVVVPNAGVNEIGSLDPVQFPGGIPVKPNLATIHVNLEGVLFTTHLALHYLRLNRVERSFKALIFIGSMASWQAIPGGPLYSASKHAVLGVMRALYPNLDDEGIRTGCIHPFFVDTAIISVPVKLFLSGIPKTPIERVAGAVFYATTDVDVSSNGSAWLLVDDGPVLQISKEGFKFGVYKMIDDRRNSLLQSASTIGHYARIAKDVGKILIGRKFLIASFGLVAAKWAWSNYGGQLTAHGQ